MNNVFCIILSKYKLYQGIVLYHSLAYNYSNFVVFILSIDDETYEICNKLNLENAIVIKANEIENEKLIRVKQERRLNEYCWTLKPFFLEYIFKNYNEGENIVYLDADLCFFNDPSPIFESKSDYSVLLSEHDYLEKNSEVEKTCGKYNSGFIVFRRCQTSLDILEWWKEKCIDWCQDRIDDGKFGDQKYLDLMPYLFEGVYSITTPGVNIAPWNEDKYRFYNNGSKVFVNDSKLILYHFCGLRLINKNNFALLIGNQKYNEVIHTPYTMVIQQTIFDIEKITPGFDAYFVEGHFEDRAKIYKMGRR